MERNTFTTAHTAALAGLHADIRGDQALHLGAPKWDGWAALDVAFAADRINLQRLVVVAVVVEASGSIAICALELRGARQRASANCTSYGDMRLLRPTSRLARSAPVVGATALDRLDSSALAAGEACATTHGSGLLLVGRAAARGQPWERLTPVYMVERQRQALGFGEVDQQACHVGCHALALLIVIDVSLSAAKLLTQGGLRDLQSLTDAFNRVHKRNTSAACL